MNIELATRNEYLIIRIKDDLYFDTDITEVKSIVEEKIEEGIGNFAISLTPNSHLSSMSVGKILQCYEIVNKKGGKIALVVPSTDDEDLLETLSFTCLIKICKSEDDL